MWFGKWRPFCLSLNVLTLKYQEMHEYKVSTVATDALVLKHQAISIHNADYTFIVLDQLPIKYYTYMVNTIRN